MSADEYPDEEYLELLRKWDTTDGTWASFMAEVRELWWQESWGWSQFQDTNGVEHYLISTGGWSGNESLIEAMQSNVMFWLMCWRQSNRGGHYHFVIAPSKTTEVTCD